MMVTLVTPDGSRQIPVTADRLGDLEMVVTITRAVILGRTPEPEPGDGPYVAFWALTKDADSDLEYDKVFGGMNAKERLLSVIMGSAEVEPELPTEVVNLDGVSVIRVDLDEQLPGNIVYVPERFVP